jgi:spermidine synthase
MFRKMAMGMQVVTDKVTTHQYDAMYSKYFEVQHRRHQKLKLLEIGLGCNMNYGPGASAHLWRKYLPAAEIWFAEFDKACVDKYKSTLDGIGIAGVLTGDQSDMEVLAQWVEQSKGSFDVIIDDGGHTNDQIYNSFMHLFVHALKPGGIYFIEDLQVQQQRTWRGTGPIMQAVLSDWMQSLLQRRRVAPLTALEASSTQRLRDDDDPAKYGLVEGAHVPKHKLPAGIKFIDCMGEMCAIIKCTLDDPHCPEGFR